jgi:NADPH:quinone reductase-like Zn-dependent oxidoreductase
VIADTVGGTSFAYCKSALKDKGKLLAIAGGFPDILAAMRTLTTSGRKVIAGPAEERPGDVRQLAELARASVLRPVIDRRYDFAQMREAHAYVETGRKRGSVVVRVGHQA